MHLKEVDNNEKQKKKPIVLDYKKKTWNIEFPFEIVLFGGLFIILFFKIMSKENKMFVKKETNFFEIKRLWFDFYKKKYFPQRIVACNVLPTTYYKFSLHWKSHKKCRDLRKIKEICSVHPTLWY